MFYRSFSLETHIIQVAIGSCVRGCVRNVSLLHSLCVFVICFVYFTFEAYTKIGVHHCTKDFPNEIFRVTQSGQPGLPKIEGTCF